MNLIDSRWHYNFNRVRLFIKNNKRYPSRYAKNPAERQIANWISAQKRAKKNQGGYKTTSDRELLLESLPNWSWDSIPKEKNWQKNFELLKDFIQENGRYPREHAPDLSEAKLEKWVRGQRRAKKGWKSYKLTPEREAQLESLPDWKWDVFKENWQKTFDALKDFVSNNNRYPTSHTIDKEESFLAKWMTRQRNYKKNNKLSLSKTQLLESLPNWKWKIDLDEIWMDNFLYAKYFIIINKKYPSRDSKDKKENQIAHWIAGQRLAKKGKGYSNSLTEKRIQLLETLPDWKWVIQGDKLSWNESYELLKTWLEEHDGVYPIPSDSGMGKKLNTWIGNQRSAKKGRGDSKMTIEQSNLLEALPNWQWEINLDDIWFDNCGQLQKFIINYGYYPKSSSNDEEESRLYRWLIKAVRNYKDKTLSSSKVNFLESLPDWDLKVNKIQESWINNLNKLRLFINREGRYPLYSSSDDLERSLYNWYYEQKYYLLRNNNPRKMQLLEQLPHWKWN